MKAKITAKKLISMLLALLMVFSVVSVPASALETNNCTHVEELGDDGWEIILAPTCSSSGQMRKWCSRCVEYAYKTIDNTPGENHVTGLWTETVQHTCTTPGVKELRCTKCDALVKRETVPAHDYTELYGQKADCMKEGYSVIMCTTCYDLQTLTYPKVPTAHSYGEWQITKEATCVVKSGERTRYCLNHAEDGTACTASETESYTNPENHVNVEWYKDKTVEATCTVEGYVPGKCLDCDTELRNIRPMHSDSYYTVISSVPSTCHTHGSEYRRCRCGYEYTVELPLDEDNHVYTDWKISKEPGCKDGERYKVCIYEYEVKVTEAIPATGEHNYGKWVVTQEPTCSLTGIRVKTCADCNGKVTEELPVKHDLTVWKTVTEMCCDEARLQQGLKYAECAGCNYTNHYIIPAVHSFSDWRIVERASCKDNKAGKLIRTCSGCGKEETKAYYAEHDFTDWVVTDKPTCEGGKTGMYTKKCKTCGKLEQKGISATHEYVDVEIIKYPVCHNDGSVDSGVKLVECKFCGERKEENISGAHVYSDWKITTDATCFVDGQKERTCYSCGYTQVDTVEAGHTYGNWYNPDGATCDVNATASVKLTRKCTKCDVTETTAEPVKLVHPNLKTVTTEATCTTSGYTRDVCPDCSYEKIYDDITPALGHDLAADWSIRVPASCSTPGSRYKACSRCEYLEFQYIEKTLHTLIQLEAGVEPTCLEPGTTGSSYCGVCYEQFSSKSVPALGHTYAEGSEVCSRCYAYKESPNCACACHSTSGMERIFFDIFVKIYQFFGINQLCSCGRLHYDEPGFFAKLFGKA